MHVKQGRFRHLSFVCEASFRRHPFYLQAGRTGGEQKTWMAGQEGFPGLHFFAQSANAVLYQKSRINLDLENWGAKCILTEVCRKIGKGENSEGGVEGIRPIFFGLRDARTKSWRFN